MAGTVTATYKNSIGAVSTGSVKFTPMGDSRGVESSGTDTPGSNPAVEIVVAAPFTVPLVSGSFTKQVVPGTYLVREFIDGILSRPFIVAVAEGATVNLKDQNDSVAGGGNYNLPEFAVEQAGYFLQVNEDASDVQWAAPPSSIVLLASGQDLPSVLAPGVLYVRVAIPSTPTLSLQGSPSDISFAVDWTASTGIVSISGYELRLDSGTPINVGNVLTHIFNSLTPETAYSVEVRAYDSAGAYSGWSVPLIVTTAVAGSGGTPPLITYSFDSSTPSGDQVTGQNMTTLAYAGGQLSINGPGYGWLHFEATGAQVANSKNVAIEWDSVTPNSTVSVFMGMVLNATTIAAGLRVFFNGSGQWVVGDASFHNADDVVMTIVNAAPSSWTTFRVEYIDGVVNVFLDETNVATTTLDGGHEAYRSGGIMGMCGDTALPWWDAIDTVRIYDLGTSA